MKALPLDTSRGADGWVRGPRVLPLTGTPQSSCGSGRTRQRPRQDVPRPREDVPCPREDVLLQNGGQTKQDGDVGSRKRGSKRGMR